MQDTTTEYGFIQPNWLLLLLAIPILIWLLNKYESKISHTLIEFIENNSQIKSTKINIITWVIVFFFLIIALSQPYYGSNQLTITGKQQNISILLDISSSMLADDISPNRLEASKRKLLDLIEMAEAHAYKSKNSVHTRFSIVLFAGDSYIFAPLTSDYQVLRSYINSISDSLITAQGTNLATAIKLADRSLSDNKLDISAIALFTDGDEAEINLKEAINTAEELNKAIFVFGIGKEAGSRILKNGKYIIDPSTLKPAISYLNEGALKDLAKKTSGEYFSYSILNQDLRKMLSVINPNLAKDRKSKIIKNVRQIGYFFVIPSTILVVFLIVKEFNTYRKLLILTILIFSSFHFFSSIAYALDSQAGLLRNGYLAYNQGDFKEAEKFFSEALKNDQYHSEALLAIAAAQYRQKKYQEASNSLAKIEDFASSKEELYQSRYNLGNNHLAQSKFDLAIEAYEKALKIRPNSQEAKHNLELAKLLKKQKQEQFDSKNKEENSSEKSSTKKQEQEQPSDNDIKNDSQNEEKNNKSPSSQDENSDSNEVDPKPTSSDEMKKHNMTPTQKDESANLMQLLDSLPDSPIVLRRSISRGDNKRPW